MEKVFFAKSLKNKLVLNLWLTVLRLFYVGVTFFGIYIGGLERVGSYDFFSLIPLSFIFLVILGIFITMLTYAYSIRAHNFKTVKILSFFQVVLDLVIIYGLYYFMVGSQSQLYILYFIPVIYSIILFRPWVPIFLGVLSTIAISNFFIEGIPENIFLIASVYIVGSLVVSVISALVDRQRRESFIQSQELLKAESELDEVKRMNAVQEIELSEVESKLKNLDQAKSDFITLTTHELRTPLSAINWAIDLIKNENDISTIKGIVEKAGKSVERMNILIDRILLVGKNAEEQEPYSFEPYDLRLILTEIVSDMSIYLDKKHLRVEVAVGDLPEVVVDPNKIRIVFEEIMLNAITYTPEGGVIRISSDLSKLNSSRQTMGIIITDSGIGIPEEEKDDIFTRFYRGREAQRIETDGTGLGLYVVQEIIRRHGGTIWFESQTGVGTSFHVELPLKQASI